jgi:hypothetical protein
MLIRCTQKLLKASRISPEDPGIQPEGLLGEWYANIAPLPYPGRMTVMFTSASTLLTVVAPGRVLRTTVPVFRARLPALLGRLGFPPGWIARELGALGEVHVTKTLDRHVLGSMNDLSYQIDSDAYHMVRYERIDWDEIEDRLADVPMSFLARECTKRRLQRIARESTSTP